MLIGISGPTVLAAQMFIWAEKGFPEEHIPAGQKDGDKFARTMCIMPDRTILMYENSHTPWKNEQKIYAIGAGSEIALGAMAFGADAIQAVEIASKYSPLCGQGVDFLTFEGEY